MSAHSDEQPHEPRREPRDRSRKDARHSGVGGEGRASSSDPETYPFDLSQLPRCGAKTRAGTPCKRYGTRRNGRCKLHGGRSTGAPIGNENAFKSGFYGRDIPLIQRMLGHQFKEMQAAKKLMRDGDIRMGGELPGIEDLMRFGLRGEGDDWEPG